MPSGKGPDFGTSANKSSINLLLAKLPYTYRIIDNISSLNPKYQDFHDLTSRKEDRIQQQSIVQHQVVPSDNLNAAIMINKDYHQYMYANVDIDKIRRLQQYRRMAAFAEVSDAIDEICDESIVEDKDGNITSFNLSGKFDEQVRKEIKKEWKKFITIFDLKNKGWEYYRQFLIDGELFFENIISQNRPDYGILGIVSIPPELINPVYDNVQNSIVRGFLLRRPNKENVRNSDKEQLIVFDKNQVTYIHSGMWNEDRTVRMPYIETARRSYKQLSLIEDSIVIYRLVRAPERLVFKVDVGNMAPAKAEQYLRKLMLQYWSRKSFDRTSGSVSQVYDPQSMLDSFWFAKRANSEGTTVDLLQGGANLGQLDDLMYFVKKLYKALKVPIGRLNPEDTFKDGTEITREELRFAKFIMRLQRQFASSFRESFMVHLKLRKLWEKYKLKEHHLDVKFNVPTQFMAMREQQLFNLKFENFNNMGNNESVAQSFAQRYYLDWSDDQMAENREWLRKDAELMWELDQIRTSGPNFREQASELEGAAAEITGGGAGGAALGSAASELGGFKPETPPEFGPGPEVPAAGAAAGAEAGAPGAPPAGGAAPTA